MSFFRPAFRSRPYGHRLLTARVVVLVGLFTWLAPAVLGVVLVVAFSVLMPAVDFDSPFAVLAAAGGMLIFAPVYGILLVPLGLLLGAWAMRFGLAGWGMAMGASIGLPLIAGAFFQWADPTGAALGAFVVLTPAVLLHAATMWAATRYLCPEALLRPLP